MTSHPRLDIKQRNLPHWQLAGSVYFVTYRLLIGTMAPDARQLIVDHLLEGRDRFYRHFVAVVMPDHVHLLLKPNAEFDLSRVMKGIKGTSARRLNELRGTRGSIWQDESYDRIMRNEEEFLQKVDYTLQNPVRAGLVQQSTDYGFSYCDGEACFGQSGTSSATRAQTGMSVPHEE